MTIDKIIKLHKDVEGRLNTRYAEYDLTINQAELLIYFYKYATNNINATDAQRDLGIDRRLMSLALKALESKGYIQRHVSEVDKRQKDIEVSAGALEMCEDLIAVKEEVNAIIEMKLDCEQIAVLKTIKLEEDNEE